MLNRIGGLNATHAQCRRDSLGFRCAKKLLKVAVFREDIGKRLLDDIIR